MKVTAALCWYAESFYALERCVCSLEGYVDRLVAFGGRWDGFPTVPDDDEQGQVNTIARACQDVGIDECEIITVEEGVWSSQVDKRSLMMQAASENSDWILVIDADEYIDGGDQIKFREGLANTEHDVAKVFLRREPITFSRRIRRVYRSGDGKIEVVKAHNGYRTEDGRFLHGDAAWVEVADAEDLGDYLRIAHDLECRTAIRVLARKSYLTYRRKGRIEVWA